MSNIRKPILAVGGQCGSRARSSRSSYVLARRVFRAGVLACGLGCGASPASTGGATQSELGALEQALLRSNAGPLTILGKCFDLPGWQTANGTGVQLWDCNGGSNQEWEFGADGTVRPIFDTTKCLDLPGWQTDSGTPIQIYDCNGGSNQQWTLGADQTLRGFGDKCVDDPAGETASGTFFQYWDCNGGSNQAFTLEDLSVGDVSSCTSVAPNTVLADGSAYDSPASYDTPGCFDSVVVDLFDSSLLLDGTISVLNDTFVGDRFACESLWLSSTLYVQLDGVFQRADGREASGVWSDAGGCTPPSLIFDANARALQLNRDEIDVFTGYRITASARTAKSALAQTLPLRISYTP